MSVVMQYFGMRYPADHKELTRARLLEAARRTFREHGFDGLSIDRLTAAAGLTRGAFYAHFSSKEALVEEVLGLEPGLTAAVRACRGDAEGGRQALRDYLTEGAIDGLIQCALVSHPQDARRGPPGRRAAWTAVVRDLIAAVEATTPEGGREEAVAMVVAAVGGAILASAVDDAALATEISGAARALI